MTTQFAVLKRESHETQELKLEKSSSDFYGMYLFYLGHEEFITGTIAQAEESVQRLLVDSLDLVDAELILKYSNLPAESKELVKWVQEWFSAALETPPPLATIVTDMAALAKEAIATHGRAYLWTLGREKNNSERRLSEFPDRIQQFVLAEMGMPEANPQEIVMYSWA